MSTIENGIWTLLEYHRSRERLTILQHFSIATLAAWKNQGHTFTDITVESLCRDFDDRINIISTDEALVYNLNQCLFSYSNLINELAEIWQIDSPKEYISILLERLIQYNGRDYGMISTPVSIISIVEQLQEICENDTCICYGSGYGFYNVSSAQKCKCSIGVDINTEAIAISKIYSYWSNVTPKYISKNLLNCTYDDFSTDDNAKILIDMPWGFKTTQIINELIANPITEPYYMNRGTGSADWAFVIHALGIAPKGRIVAIMVGNPLYNTGTADLKIRRSLVNRKAIEGIITLPDMLYSPVTGIPVNLVILSPNNAEIKMFDASRFGNKEKRRKVLSDADIQQIVKAYETCTDGCMFVSPKTLEENDYNLSPQRYRPKNAFYNDNTVETICLKNIVNSINYQLNMKSADFENSILTEPTKLRYLTIQNLSDYGIFTNLSYLNMSSINQSKTKYIVNENLILFKQSPFRSGIVYANDDEQVIAKGNLYILDIDKSKINPIYLMLYLRSEKGLNQLNAYAQGGGMKIINIKDLEKMEIPLIPLNEQNRIAEKYKEYAAKLQNMEIEKRNLFNKIDRLL